MVDQSTYYCMRGEKLKIIMRQNLLFSKKITCTARAPPARARAAREGRRDESTVNNSGSKLKIRHTSTSGNLLLFPMMGRASCELTYYARRKVENNNETKSTVFKKNYMHRARAPPACTRAAREGRRDESTVTNSGFKLKIRHTSALGNRMARLSGLFLGPGDNF